MMVKRYARAVDSKTVVISRETDMNDNTNEKVVVYFDAAFSRKVVSEKKITGGFCLVDKILFVFDPKTFKEERGFPEFSQYLNTNSVPKITGNCDCSYNVNKEAIYVHIP